MEQKNLFSISGLQKIEKPYSEVEQTKALSSFSTKRSSINTKDSEPNDLLAYRRTDYGILLMFKDSHWHPGSIENPPNNVRRYTLTSLMGFIRRRPDIPNIEYIRIPEWTKDWMVAHGYNKSSL